MKKQLNKLKNIRKYLTVAYGVLIALTVFVAPVSAAGDALTVINNMSTFVFSLIRALGMIMLGFGIVQVGLSFKSHDPSQKANGIMTVAGGAVITFAKEILNVITA